MKNQKGFRESIRHADSVDEIQTLSGKVNQVVEEIPEKTRRRIVLAVEKRMKELSELSLQKNKRK